MDVLVEEFFGFFEEFAGEDDCGGGSVADHVVLGFGLRFR